MDTGTGSAGTSSGGNGAAGGGSASVDTGSAADTDTGSDSVDTGGTDSGDAGGGADGAAATSTGPKFKVRRLGREQEFAAEELAKMLDDDYEHDFHGAGGKPLLQDGKPVKMRWRDIVRAVQMHKGATDAARQHNEARQRIESIFEQAKDPQHRPLFFEEHLGVEDYDKWVLEEADRVISQQEKLVELAKTNPFMHQAELRRLEKERFERRQELKSQREQAQAKRQQSAQRMEQFWQRVEGAFGKVGLKLNARTREIADRITAEFAEAKAGLSFEQLAEYVRDEWHEDLFGYLDGHDDEKLLGLLGNSRRERLRKAELEALKGKKREERQAAPKPAVRTESRDKGGMTAEEFLRKSKNGGRV